MAVIARGWMIGCLSVLGVLSGCAGTREVAVEPGTVQASGEQREVGGAPDAAAAAFVRDPAIEVMEPWSFLGRAGVLLRTRNHRVFATQPDAFVRERLPSFLESALARYRTALCGEGESLPAPGLKLDTYLLASRHEWEQMTRHLLGAQAGPFLGIERGGYAWGGRAVLFDLGEADTFTIAAHEGWHAYTQRTFNEMLPVWAEEMIATWMEGHELDADGGVRFVPRRNEERLADLRGVVVRGELLRLSDFLSVTPDGFISARSANSRAGTTDPASRYYAHAWAAGMFLNERYADGLCALVKDASAGRMSERVGAALGPTRAQGRALREGPAVFVTYFSRELDEVDREFEGFVRELVSAPEPKN